MAGKDFSSVSGVTSGGSESRGSSSLATAINRQNALKTSGRLNQSRNGGGFSGGSQKKISSADVQDIKLTGTEIIDWPLRIALAFGAGTANGYGDPALDEGF